MTVRRLYKHSFRRLGEGVRPDQTVATETPSSGDQNELVTLREAAELLGISHGQALRLVNRGGLKARNIGRRWYPTRGEVERFARRMEAKS